MQVARDRFTLLSVFLIVPKGLTRSLAAMSVALTAEDEEEEAENNGGAPDGGQGGDATAAHENGGGHHEVGEAKAAFGREENKSVARITLDGVVRACAAAAVHECALCARWQCVPPPRQGWSPCLTVGALSIPRAVASVRGA